MPTNLSIAIVGKHIVLNYSGSWLYTKTHQIILFFALALASALSNPAQAEIRALSNTELEASATIYRGQVVGIQWQAKPASGCVSSVKEATISLQLNSSHGKTNGKPVLVKGFVNVLNGCPGSAGNWLLKDLKVGDKVVIYAKKLQPIHC